jgi:hypothetical protein
MSLQCDPPHLPRAHIIVALVVSVDGRPVLLVVLDCRFLDGLCPTNNVRGGLQSAFLGGQNAGTVSIFDSTTGSRACTHLACEIFCYTIIP